MSLMERLERYRGRSVHVLINRGNAGDGLINLAGRELLESLDIQCREFLHPAPARGDTLLIHGCGGFGGVSTHAVQHSQAYFDCFDDIVVLPSSFDPSRPQVREFLENLPAHVTVFCRERISYELVLECAAHPDNIGLSEDLAFFYDYSPWMEKQASGTLVCFRTDSDTAQAALPRCSIDVSRYGDKHDAWPLMYCVSLFEEVHTDRMHVGIVAAKLGKRTYYYDNNYHKIRATYEHSMTTMENVHYMGTARPDVSPSWRSCAKMRILDVLMRLRKPLLRVATFRQRRHFLRPDPRDSG